MPATAKKRRLVAVAAPTPAVPDLDRWDVTVLLCRGLSHSFKWGREYLRGTGVHRYTGVCTNGCGVTRTVSTDAHGELLRPGSKYSYAENPEYLSRSGRVPKADVRSALNRVDL